MIVAGVPSGESDAQINEADPRLHLPRAGLDELLRVPRQSARQDDLFIDAIERMKANQPCDKTVAGSPTTDCSLDFLSPSDDPTSIGRVGTYEIKEIVGRGGMGIVFRGYDAKLNRVVAVKVLAPELALNTTARQRFQREGRAAAAVRGAWLRAADASPADGVQAPGGLPTR